MKIVVIIGIQQEHGYWKVKFPDAKFLVGHQVDTFIHASSDEDTIIIVSSGCELLSTEIKRSLNFFLESSVKNGSIILFDNTRAIMREVRAYDR